MLLAYVLSFVYIGIYWNNHHHMLSAVRRVSGGTLWANQHLLFWLSLVPFTTAWMSENDFPTVPVAVYGITLLAAGIAYYILQTMLLRADVEGSLLAAAVGSDVKGRLSPVLYCVGIGLTFVNRWLGIIVTSSWRSCGWCRTGGSNVSSSEAAATQVTHGVLSAPSPASGRVRPSMTDA